MAWKTPGTGRARLPGGDGRGRGRVDAGTVPHTETDARELRVDQAFVRKERASHRFLDATGCEEIQGSLPLFLPGPCSIPQMNGQRPKGRIAHACLWIETLKRSHGPAPSLPVNSQSRLMSNLTHRGPTPRALLHFGVNDARQPSK